MLEESLISEVGGNRGMQILLSGKEEQLEFNRVETEYSIIDWRIKISKDEIFEEREFQWRD